VQAKSGQKTVSRKAVAFVFAFPAHNSEITVRLRMAPSPSTAAIPTTKVDVEEKQNSRLTPAKQITTQSFAFKLQATYIILDILI
jgi:hypothetical protein